jgi:hypothetical protein
MSSNNLCFGLSALNICKHSSIVNTDGNFSLWSGKFKFKTVVLFADSKTTRHLLCPEDADKPRSIMDARYLMISFV